MPFTTQNIQYVNQTSNMCGSVNIVTLTWVRLTTGRSRLVPGDLCGGNITDQRLVCAKWQSPALRPQGRKFHGPRAKGTNVMGKIKRNLCNTIYIIAVLNGMQCHQQVGYEHFKKSLPCGSKMIEILVKKKYFRSDMQKELRTKHRVFL